MPWNAVVYQRAKLMAYKERLEENASEVKTPLSFTASAHKDIHAEGAPQTVEDNRTVKNRYSQLSSTAGKAGTSMSDTTKLLILGGVLVAAWVFVRS